MREFHAEGSIPTPIEEIAEFKCRLDIIPLPGLRDLLEIDGFISSDLSSITVDQQVAQRYAYFAFLCGSSSSGINRCMYVTMLRTAEEGKLRHLALPATRFDINRTVFTYSDNLPKAGFGAYPLFPPSENLGSDAF